MNGKRAKQIKRLAEQKALKTQTFYDYAWFGSRWWVKLIRWVRGNKRPKFNARKCYRRAKKFYTQGSDECQQ